MSMHNEQKRYNPMSNPYTPGRSEVKTFAYDNNDNNRPGGMTNSYNTTYTFGQNHKDYNYYPREV